MFSFDYLFLLAGLAFAKPQSRIYAPQTDFTSTPSQFFQQFDFFTYPDPTHGTVNYVDEDTASISGLIGNNASEIFIGVSKQALTSGIRDAVRISSTQTFNPGTLLVIDIAHIPETCGSWPALWMVGANAEWPNGGEFDIIEGGNVLSATNTMTLHTTAGCSIDPPKTANRKYSGDMLTQDCNVNAPNQSTNQGCSVTAAPGTPTFGSTFNSAGGGTFIAEWAYIGFNIWFFPAGSTLPPLLSTNPNTTEFGTPIAQFAGDNCDWNSHFKDMQIVINTSLCGDWAGAVWQSGGCAAETGFATCEDYVLSGGDAFGEAYWAIRALKTFERVGGAPSRISRERL